MVRMAEAQEADTVKLICGMISARAELFDRAAEALADAFGPVDLTSEIMPFDMTDYYEPQMGPGLLRRFVSFAEPFSPAALVEAKLRTNAIEADFASRRGADAPARPINLDPGYVAPSKLVLASMKDFSHRIYVRDGVYAEVTLLYRKGLWEALEWTFPDFAGGRYDAFLTAARTRLAAKAGEESQP